MLRNRASFEPMTWQQDHLRALPTRVKKKSNLLKNVCVGVFSAWLVGMIIFFVFYFNKSTVSSSPQLRSGAPATTRKLEEQREIDRGKFYDDDSVNLIREHEHVVHSASSDFDLSAAHVGEEVVRNADENRNPFDEKEYEIEMPVVDGKVDPIYSSIISQENERLNSSLKASLIIKKYNGEEKEELSSPKDIKMALGIHIVYNENNSQVNNNTANISKSKLVKLSNVSTSSSPQKIVSKVMNISDTVITTPPRNSNKEINVDSVLKQLMKDREQKMRKEQNTSPLQLNHQAKISHVEEFKPLLHAVKLSSSSLHSTIESATGKATIMESSPKLAEEKKSYIHTSSSDSSSDENWEIRLLRSAHEKIRLQYPECSAKIRWYCHEKGVDCSENIALIDSMQTLVANEQSSGKPNCPSISTFSMGRVWRSAWYIDENDRRTNYVPYWRELLLQAGHAAASSKQLGFSDQFQSNLKNGYQEAKFQDIYQPPPPLKDGSLLDGNLKQTASLLIVVLTYPRPNNQAFLLKTLTALQTQINEQRASSLNDSFSIAVAVMNSGGNEHPHHIFKNASEANELKGGSKMTDFGYFDNPFLMTQPSPESWVKSRLAQQISNQSWHVMSALATASVIGSQYTMVMEDDMELCPGALSVLLEDIQSAAHSDNEFTALLVSYGLNGLVVQTSDIAPAVREEEVPQKNDNEQEGYLLDFLIANRNPIGCEECVTPPDIAVYEWSYLHHYPDYHMDLSFTAKANKPPKYQERVAYTRNSNLFSHLGTLSSTFENRIFEAEQYRCGGILQFSREDSVRVLRQHPFSISAQDHRGASVLGEVGKMRSHQGFHEKGNTHLIDIVRDNSGGHISVLRSDKHQDNEDITVENVETRAKQIGGMNISEGFKNLSILESYSKLQSNKQANEEVLKLREKKKRFPEHHSNIPQ